MRIYDNTPPAPAPPAPPTAKPTPKSKATPALKPTPTPQLATNVLDRLSDRDPGIRYSGAWQVARFPAYEGGAVRYATGAGARATLTVNAHAITWIGPVGPTRGQARVYVDGKLAATVDLYAGEFAARKSLFAKSWAKDGKHTIAIKVVGTRGRPFIAIDELTATEERSR